MLEKKGDLKLQLLLLLNLFQAQEHTNLVKRVNNSQCQNGALEQVKEQNYNNLQQRNLDLEHIQSHKKLLKEASIQWEESITNNKNMEHWAQDQVDTTQKIKNSKKPNYHGQWDPNLNQEELWVARKLMCQAQEIIIQFQVLSMTVTLNLARAKEMAFMTKEKQNLCPVHSNINKMPGPYKKLHQSSHLVERNKDLKLQNLFAQSQVREHILTKLWSDKMYLKLCLRNYVQTLKNQDLQMFRAQVPMVISTDQQLQKIHHG